MKRRTNTLKMATKRIFRDNVGCVSKLAIKRLSQKAHCQKISGLVYEEIRKVIMVFTIRVLAAVDCGAKLTGEDIADVVRDEFGIVVKPTESVEGVQIAKAVMTRIMREVAQNLDKDFKFAKNASPTFHYALEDYLVEVLGKAAVHMANDKRTTLFPGDISGVVGYSSADNFSTITSIAYNEK